MPIFQQGSLNTTALVVPDLYVQIVPPQNLLLNGVPTNIIGVVGTAPPWAPHSVVVTTSDPTITAGVTSITAASFVVSFSGNIAGKSFTYHVDL